MCYHFSLEAERIWVTNPKFSVEILQKVFDQLEWPNEISKTVISFLNNPDYIKFANFALSGVQGSYTLIVDLQGNCLREVLLEKVFYDIRSSTRALIEKEGGETKLLELPFSNGSWDDMVKKKDIAAGDSVMFY